MNSVIVKIGKNKKTIKIDNNSKIIIDNNNYSFELIHLQNSTYLLKIQDQFFKVNYLEKKDEQYVLSIDGQKYITSSKSPLKEKAEELVNKKNLNIISKILKAPMPGMVLEIKVNVGEKVNKGDTLLVLEAMKMENSIKSSFKGIIKEIYIEKNSAVEKDEKLLSIE